MSRPGSSAGDARPPLPEEEAGRAIQLHDEYLSAARDLADLGPAVVFFGSARTPPDHPSAALVRELATRVGRLGYAVLTGSGAGLMEAANAGARDAGALSVGLHILLPTERQPNAYVDRAVSFRHFILRKTMFIRHGSAFVVAPGGFGTLDELFEVLTLMQTGTVRSVPMVLLGRQHWAPLVTWFRDRLAGGAFIDPADLARVTLADTVEEALAALALPALPR